MFKKFVSYYRKHLGLFLIDMAAALIMAGIDLIYPSFTRTFMNDYIPKPTREAELLAGLDRALKAIGKG